MNKMAYYPKNKSVLFVTYGGGHVNMVVPVIKELQKASGLEIKVLGLTTAGIILEKNGIPYYGFRHFIGEDGGRAIGTGKRLSDGINNQLVPEEETAAYMGLSYMELEDAYGVEKAASLYAEKGRQAFLPVRLFERILGELKPDIVIATNSPRSERASIIAAGNLNIPSVCLVDLFASWESEWIGKSGYADRVCVLAEAVRKKLVDGGRTPSEIVVTGNPAFDRLADECLEKKAKAFRQEKGLEGKKVILWASQPEPKAHPSSGAPGDPGLPRKIDAALFEALRSHPDWHLIIRLHPSENAAFDTLPERVSLSGKLDDLPTVLKASDAVVTMTSTVGLEGVLLGKPLVTVDMSVGTSLMNYSGMGLSIGVKSFTELEGALASALGGKAGKDAGIPAPGTAAKNVAGIILTLLGVKINSK